MEAGVYVRYEMIDTSAFQGKSAAYFTLGCKLNFSETSTFGRLLGEMGVRTVDKDADICIINTCSVTEVADHKCRQAIHRMVRNNPGAFVVVTGCYAQLKPETVARIDGVDLVLGANEKANLIQFLSEAWSGGKQDASLHIHHTVKTKDIRTFLYVLHHSLCPRLQPQPWHRVACCPGAAGRG